MAKTKTIIEAEANLQAAKMLQAIENLDVASTEFSALTSSWDESDLSIAEKTMRKSLQLIESLKDFQKMYQSRRCYSQDVKFVKNIINGIELRSSYEAKIEKLEARLEKALGVYKSLAEANVGMRKQIEKIIEALAKGEVDSGYLDQLVLDSINNYSFEKVIDRLMHSYKPVTKCNNDSELPF